MMVFKATSGMEQVIKEREWKEDEGEKWTEWQERSVSITF